MSLPDQTPKKIVHLPLATKRRIIIIGVTVGGLLIFGLWLLNLDWILRTESESSSVVGSNLGEIETEARSLLENARQTVREVSDRFAKVTALRENPTERELLEYTVRQQQSLATYKNEKLGFSILVPAFHEVQSSPQGIIVTAPELAVEISLATDYDGNFSDFQLAGAAPAEPAVLNSTTVSIFRQPNCSTPADCPKAETTYAFPDQARLFLITFKGNPEPTDLERLVLLSFQLTPSNGQDEEN